MHRMTARLFSAALLVGLAGNASATEFAVAKYEEGIIPVLVNVNKAGEVTSVTPAQKMKPSWNRMMRDTIKQIVTAPATDEQGHAIASQIVMRMKLESTPDSDKGQYSLHFVPVEVVSVPAGVWSWRVSGTTYALSNDRSMPALRDSPSMESARGPVPTPAPPPPSSKSESSVHAS